MLGSASNVASCPGALRRRGNLEGEGQVRGTLHPWQKPGRQAPVRRGELGTAGA